MAKRSLRRDMTKKHKPRNVIQSSIHGDTESFIGYVSDLGLKKAKRKLLIEEIMRRRKNER